jgi:hypothetical protein
MRLALPIGFFTCIALLAACSADSPEDVVSPQLDEESAASGSFAGGHGNWTNAAGESVSRSFYARLMPDGTVSGEFIQHVTALDGTVRKNQSEIDCMHFLAPNDVVLSGVVKVNANPAAIGQTQIFREVDNGEGEGSIDEQSPIFFRQPSTGLDCRNLIPTPITPIEGGNVQVRP